MSLLDNMGFNREQRRDRGKPELPPNATFRITQEGRVKLQGFDGDARSRVLMALETGDGSSNVDEISQAARLSRAQVERILPKLVKQGYVQPAGGFGGSRDAGMDDD